MGAWPLTHSSTCKEVTPLPMSHREAHRLGHWAASTTSGPSLLPPYAVLLFAVVSRWGRFPGPELPDGEQDWDTLQTRAPAMEMSFPYFRVM